MKVYVFSRLLAQLLGVGWPSGLGTAGPLFKSSQRLPDNNSSSSHLFYVRTTARNTFETTITLSFCVSHEHF